MTKTNEIPEDYWPCACVKRDRRGNMSHIKLHPPNKRTCKTCGCKRPPEGWNKTGGQQ